MEMRTLRKTKNKLICGLLMVVMVVSFMIHATISEAASQNQTNNYVPYYNEKTKQLEGCPAVGDILYVGDTFDGEKLEKQSVDMHFYLREIDMTEDEEEDYVGHLGTQVLKGGEKISIQSDTYNFDLTKGWKVYSIEYKEETQNIQIVCIAKEPSNIISNVEIKINWEKFSYFKLGASYPVWDVDESCVTIQGTGIEGLGGTGLRWLIKARQEHVDKGYITQELFDKCQKEDDGWLDSTEYRNSDYVISETEEYYIGMHLLPEQYYDFAELDGDISGKITLKNQNVKLMEAHAYSYANFRMAYVKIELGTAMDVINAINGNEASESKVDFHATIQNEAEVKRNLVLTKEEQQLIASGSKLEVVLKFNHSGVTVDTEEKKAITSKLGKNKLGTFLNIELWKKIGNNESKVSETQGMIQITFDVPEELRNTDSKLVRIYKIMRNHDGKIDFLNANYDSATGKITFETNQFSTYALVYTDAEVQMDVPNTGDINHMMCYLLIGMAGMIGIVVVNKKRFY